MRKLISHTKHILILFIIFVSATLLLCSCAAENDAENYEINVVCANFAGYDFACEVVGRDNDRVNVHFLSAGGAHAFEPSYMDIARIKTCDLFIYVGGESDASIDALLASLDGVNAFKMTDCVELLPEHAEQDADTDAVEDHVHEHDHEQEYDEHVWTSPYNAALISEALCAEMSRIDPGHSEQYLENTGAYVEELLTLDREFSDFFASIEKKPLIFGDRFPFRYFAQRYSLEYYAAMSGCSHSSEPSVKTVVSLIERVKSEKVKAVFYIESGTHAVAQRIAEEAGVSAVLFNSCHKISSEEIAAGTTYLSVMYENLDTLKRVLA